ncbi:MAG: four helix bundle protein [Candidatus Omnitrophica bacterium]|nr:four helix bundle protein [Candidatus Omnitrophota bacterium]
MARTMIKSFHELQVWQKADALAHRVFDLTETFPRSYLFDLTSQLRRAALSVPTNLAEGCATSHTKELLQFINVARRSVSETLYLLLFAFRRELLKAPLHEQLRGSYEEVVHMLTGLTHSLRTSNTAKRNAEAVRVLAALVVFWSLFTGQPSLDTSHCAYAQVPHVIRYQGTATDGAGVALEGPYTVTCRLYDAATGGAKLWEEVTPNVAMASGRFALSLGTVTPLNLPFDRDYWVSIELNQDGEMTPRQRIMSVPMAMRAEVADGLSSAVTPTLISPQGSESGLDADTVDGMHAADLLNRDNHTGTQLPATLSPQGAGSGLNADMVDGLHANQIRGGPFTCTVRPTPGGLTHAQTCSANGEWCVQGEQGGGESTSCSTTNPGFGDWRTTCCK